MVEKEGLKTGVVVEPPCGGQGKAAALAVVTAGAILCCNRPFCRLTGLAGPQAPFAELLAWIAPEDRDPFRRQLAQQLQVPSLPVTCRIREAGGQGGEPQPWIVRMDPLEGPGGAVVLLRLEGGDGMPGPERRSLKDEAKLQHEGRLAALGTMAAGIAHELNQPLNTIRVVTEGLLFGREQGWPLDTEEFFENIEMITRQVVRMDKVIQNIRNFGRENRDSGTTSANLNEAIENVLAMVGRQIEDHGIRMEKDLDPELPPLRAAPNALEQVLMNLLINARQALDDWEEPHKTIRITTARKADRLFLAVRDNGPGIPPRLLDRIFDPFFTTKGPGKGTGLGLSISQSIVSKFGGHIEAFNNQEGGATFLITVALQGALP
jgi:signal transduction histidine kinase